MRDDCAVQGLTEDVTLRPRSSRVLAAALVGVAALGLLGVLATGRTELIVRAIPPLGLLGFGAWTTFWHPAVRIGAAGVTMINPMQTVTTTWPAVEDVQTRWSLAVVTARGVHTAWAAPRPSRMTSALSVRRDVRGLADYAAERRRQQEPGRATGDIAAHLVTVQWSQYRDRGLLGAVEGAGVEIHWHVTTVLVLAALASAWVLVLVLP